MQPRVMQSFGLQARGKGQARMRPVRTGYQTAGLRNLQPIGMPQRGL